MRLPQPSDDFEWAQAPPGQRLVCRPLGRIATHLFTTREWRLGSAACAEADEAWEEVARAAAVDLGHLARVRQVHGASVLIHRATDWWRGTARPKADIVASDDPELALAIQTADCVPLLIGDARTGAVAAVHAGWRGLAAGVPVVAVDALTRAFGSRPSDLIVAVGPSIGACCYEVGAEVRTRFERAGFPRALTERWFCDEARPSAVNRPMPGLPGKRRQGHWFFDGWQAARDQLRTAGLAADAIHVAELCTASHPKAFCSYRRDGAPAGCLAAAIRSPGLMVRQG